MDVRLVQDPLRPAREMSAESALEALAGDVEKRLDATAARAEEAIEREQRDWKRLVDVLAVRHEEALELFYEATGAHPADAWGRIRSYHAKTVRSLWPEIEACLAHFDEQAPPGRIWTDAVESLEAFSESLPQRIEAWLDPAVYAPGEDEGLYITSRKIGTRLRLWSRESTVRFRNSCRELLGREDLPLPGTTRPVPVRDIVLYHASVRLAGEVAPGVVRSERLRRHRAEQLVSACARWNIAILDAEYQLTQVRAGATELDERQVASWRDARQAARRLQEDIEALAALEPEQAVDVDLPSVGSQLREDLENGGTYLLESRRVQRSSRESARLYDAADETSLRLERVGARLKLEHSAFEMREAVITHRRSLLDRMEQLSVAPVRKTFSAMRAQIDQAAEMLHQAPDEPEELMEALDRIRGQLTRRLQSALASLPGIATAGIAAALPDGIDERQTEAARLPERLLVAGEPEEASDKAMGRTRAVDVADIAAAAFDDTINERLRRDAELFRTEMLALWNDAEQATQIITYNLNTAQEELARRLKGASGDAPVKALAAEGLELAADTLDQLEDRIAPLWQSYESAVVSVTQADWLRFFRDLTQSLAGRNGVAGMRTKLNRRAESLLRRGQERDAARNGKRYASSVQEHVRAILGGGMSAAVPGEPPEEDRIAALDMITRAEALLEEIPFVYRRLFSFDPVTDPVFLEGRDADLNRLDQHFERWRLGRTASPVNFLFEPGAGRTSFLNVVEARLRERNLDVARIPAEDRIRSEAELVAQLARAMRMDPLPGTLDDLGRQVVDRASGRHMCLIVDHLESLMLQAAGGSDLVVRFFDFIARTDGHVFFVFSASTAAWALIRQGAGVAASVAVVHTPVPVTQEVLEGIILNRHRRSGLRLQFEEPQAPDAHLRQQLRRARDEEERQDCLRRAYFSRLYQLSGGSIRLAILHWIRSLRIDSGVTARPLTPARLEVLDDLDLDRTFSVRALLLHRRLSAADLAAVFRVPNSAAETTLESLTDRRLIERVAGASNGETSYQVVPLLQQPVAEALRARNML